MAKSAGNILEDERNAQMIERNTVARAPKQEPKVREAGFNVPLPLLRWIGYTVVFMLLSFPFLSIITILQWLSASWILAHFAGQINGLKNDR